MGGAVMTNWLTQQELKDLTGYTRKSRQRLALAQMNIRFITRPLDGFPLVSREILHLNESRTVFSKASSPADHKRELVS